MCVIKCVKGGAEKSIAPNAMWQKRPYGQIAKCAEAQALRKAFPEVGSQPTADEMEGNSLDMGPAEIVQPAAPSSYPEADFEKNLPAWSKNIIAGKMTPEDVILRVQTKAPLTDAQKARLMAIQRDRSHDVSDVQATSGPTYAQAADGINAAKTQEDLDALDETIGAVANDEHRAELAALVEQRRNQLPPF